MGCFVANTDGDRIGIDNFIYNKFMKKKKSKKKASIKPRRYSTKPRRGEIKPVLPESVEDARLTSEENAIKWGKDFLKVRHK